MVELEKIRLGNKELGEEKEEENLASDLVVYKPNKPSKKEFDDSPYFL